MKRAPKLEDPYKSERKIKLPIARLSEFAKGEPESRRYSAPLYLRGLPWKIYATHRDELCEKGQGHLQKCLGCFLECNTEDKDPAWSCAGSITLLKMKYVVREDGTADYVRINVFANGKLFNAADNSCGFVIPFDALMDPVNGWYDGETDSIRLFIHIAAEEPYGLKNVPDVVYKQYSINSERALLVKYEDGSSTHLWIQDKIWTFNYSSANQTLSLETSMHPSETSKTIAECIFWYWNDKEIVILKKTLHAFVADSSKVSVSTSGSIPVNRKFNVVIRLLGEKTVQENNNLEAYYGDYEGIDTVTLSIAGTQNASFVVPKYVLMQASPVFQRMFSTEMTEKAMGKVDQIKDTNPQEFGDFLKAISPKQESPNPSNVFGLLKLADRYQCQLLRTRCEEHLMNCVEIPLVHLLTCAKDYKLDKLKKNLLMNFKECPGLFKMYKESKPYIEMLHLVKEMDLDTE